MSNIDKQALRSKALSASPDEWIKETSDGWGAICSSDVQANGGFIIAHFVGPDSQANREFVQAAHPATVLALLDELEAKDQRLNEILKPNMLLPVIDDMDADNLRQVIKTASENYSLLHAKWEAAENRAEAAEKRIAELEVLAFSPAILDVISERQRQRSVEGWTSEHDDAYQNSELADAAACYAIHAHNQGFSTPAHWPWAPEWWKQSGARRDLVKAGALILAEIERLDRSAGKGE
jgi:hypothetical protein